jgi:hypothetical protein
MSAALFKMLGLDESTFTELGRTVANFDAKLDQANASLTTIKKALATNVGENAVNYTGVSFYDDLLDEEQELAQRLKQIYTIKQRPEYNELSEKIQTLIDDQHAAMVVYLDCLVKRINILNTKQRLDYEQD